MTKKLTALVLMLTLLLGTATAARAADVIILNNLTMEVGDETDLTFSDPQGKKVTVKWKSEDTSICTVNSKGTVTGKKAGKCIVSAKWNGNTYGIKITVKEPEKPSSFNAVKNYLINNGEEQKNKDEGNDHFRLWQDNGFHFAINYNEGGTIEFFVGKPKPNTKLGDYCYDYGLRLYKSKSKKNSAFFYKTGKKTRQYAANPKKGTLNIGNGLDFKRYMDSEKIEGAKKKANKLLLKSYPIWDDYLQGHTGISMKSIGITCKTTALSKTKLTMYAKSTYTLKLKNATASAVKWSSSNKKVATVTSKGKVTALKKGSATITAKYKSKSYKCKLKVI